MKVLKAALAAVLGLVLGVSGFVATATRAEAHVPEVSATCSVLSVNLKSYQGMVAARAETFKTVHHEEVGTPTIPNPDYVPAVPKTDDTPEVPAVGDPTIPNPQYVAAYDEKVGNGDAVAPKVNHVAVLVNGAEVENTDFGSSYSKTFPVVAGDQYKVIVRAWDDPDGSKGWSKNFNGTIVACPVENKVCTTIANGPVSTNLNDLWANVDTRSAGHVEYVTNGLHVWTDDATSNAKVSEGIPANFPLKNTGALSLAWTGSTPPPGINLFVNFGADGNGTLVYESVYGQDLWLTNGSSAAVKAKAPVNGGGNGSQWHGTITQWLSVYPDAQVVGIAYSLGSGVKGDGVISSITAGCTSYTFDYKQSPKPDDKVWTGEWTNGEWGCGDTSFEQTRKIVTTPYVLKDREWVLDTANAVTTYEHRTVALTGEQMKWYQNTDAEGECYVEPKVKDATTVVTTETWACDATTAVTSTVTTTYAFVLDPKTGEYGDAIPTAGAPVAGTRDLTAAEFVACPVTVLTVPTLAKTGADVNPWGLAGGAATLLTGLVLLVARRRKA